MPDALLGAVAWEGLVRAGKSRLRSLKEIDLDVVFYLHYPRKVKKEGPFSFQLRHIAGERNIEAPIPGQKFMVLKDGQKIAVYLS